MLEAIKNRVNEYVVQYLTETLAKELSEYIDEFVEGLVRSLPLGKLLLPPPISAKDEAKVIYQEPEIMYDPDEAYVQAA